MLSANRRVHQLRTNPSSKVSNGYAGKFLKAGLNFDWSALTDDFRTFLLDASSFERSPDGRPARAGAYWIAGSVSFIAA
jgi:hypothetical protein